jgi:hypothetical protein
MEHFRRRQLTEPLGIKAWAVSLDDKKLFVDAEQG